MLRTRHVQSLALRLCRLGRQAVPPALSRSQELGDSVVESPRDTQCRVFHSSPNRWAQAALAVEGNPDAATVIFPREQDGVSYALNWALAAVGVPPQGRAFRNLKSGKLESEHKAKLPPAASGTPIHARGGKSTGATAIDKKSFNRLFKEVTGHLSSADTLFVHDGAIGSAPATSAKVRTVADSASASLALQQLLNTTSTRDLSADAFPLTVYSATAGEPLIAVDYDRMAVIVQGKAIGDRRAVASALAALAGPQVAAAGAIPLAAGRCLIQEGATLLVVAPEGLVEAVPALAATSVSDAPGVAWNEGGVSRFFGGAKTAPNLLAPPAALVLVIQDSTGAVPVISKISASQAAYFFLAGYTGDKFVPAYVDGPSAMEALGLAQQLGAMVNNTGVAAYLLNVAGSKEGSFLADSEVSKLLASAVTQKAPKGKKPDEQAVAALKEKFTSCMSSTYKELPEGIAM